ncbi:hypothetical protein GCWU000342_00653 [Shuttleworthella satelles DSM 14600]|uniref:Uncharacterized protein n=1 Tax=Shuttleworthella satelles DSM 14600 TaxID=626523 RepID=C4G9K0_9FIRM|nr:hypothetical protein GCWU000342_00653 [Shuttleworthia satelles DSM 14600]
MLKIYPEVVNITLDFCLFCLFFLFVFVQSDGAFRSKSRRYPLAGFQSSS